MSEIRWAITNSYCRKVKRSRKSVNFCFTMIVLKFIYCSLNLQFNLLTFGYLMVLRICTNLETNYINVPIDENVQKWMELDLWQLLQGVLMQIIIRQHERYNVERSRQKKRGKKWRCTPSAFHSGLSSINRDTFTHRTVSAKSNK